jgi:hypothetical protein
MFSQILNPSCSIRPMSLKQPQLCFGLFMDLLMKDFVYCLLYKILINAYTTYLFSWAKQLSRADVHRMAQKGNGKLICSYWF